MSIIVPCASAIGILGIIASYQVYLSAIFDGSYKDRLYYYNSHLINLTPIIIYSTIIIEELINGLPTDFLKYIYIEWLFSTPIMLINIGRLTHIPLNYYIYIILLDQLMLLCAYISYLTTNSLLSYILYGIGVICYCTINAIYYVHLKTTKEMFSSPLLKTKIIRTILLSITLLWSGYPIIHILLKTNNITSQESLYAYITLDVLTKGIFTTLLLGYCEVYQKHTSWLHCLTRKIFRVHPLEVPHTNNKLEEILEAKKDTSLDLHTIEVSTNIVSDMSKYTNKSKYTDSIKVISVNSDIETISYNKGRRSSYILTLESVNETTKTQQ
jgi:bacteriorhodopsin